MASIYKCGADKKEDVEAVGTLASLTIAASERRSRASQTVELQKTRRPT